MKKQNLVRNYEDLVEQFFRETQRILYLQIPLERKIRMLHGAHYRATYYLQINNQLLLENFQSTDRS